MTQDNFTTARIVNIVLGIWLFISAFLWPHSYAQMNNTWIVGILTVAFALIATKVPEVRYLNTILAVWLFISVWALPSVGQGTMWNNAVMAIALFFVSMAPSYLENKGSRGTIARP